MQKAKWLSEEALQIALKRREVKSKGEKERYLRIVECNLENLSGHQRIPDYNILISLYSERVLLFLALV